VPKVVYLITSSSNKLGPGEYRTPPADKVWVRMAVKGCAAYNEETDIYTFINQ
jgi:hypothetical protein